MRVLTVYAHHNPQSFCHALLDRFSAGLADAGHTHEVVDLYAIDFDPVLREHDEPNWIDESVPDDVLGHMRLKERIMDRAERPMRRMLLKHWLAGRTPREVIRGIRARGGPRDIAEQQEKVARAEGLAFIAPVYFVGFPAILKGWIERVFTLGFAFGLTPEGWRGDIRGRIPLLRHQKAQILSTTIFNQASYEEGLAQAMRVLVDDFALRYPGIQRVEHEFFYAVQGADDATRARYLDRAYQLGAGFAATPSQEYPAHSP